MSLTQYVEKLVRLAETILLESFQDWTILGTDVEEPIFDHWQLATRNRKVLTLQVPWDKATTLSLYNTDQATNPPVERPNTLLFNFKHVDNFLSNTKSSTSSPLLT